MKIVIPSRNRVKELKAGALSLFPDATVCVGESEVDMYKSVTKRLLVHPDSITGIGPLRQWILDNVKDQIVVQVDDDVYKLYSLCGIRGRSYHDPETAMRVVSTTAQCALDAGVSAFGFNQAWDVRKFRFTEPFLLKSWSGGIVGFVGRKHRYDTSLKLRADIDFFFNVC